MNTARPLQFLDATHVRWGRRPLLYFAGSNYLGLSWSPRLRESLARALQAGPLQTGASRATTGDHAAFARTERAIARFFRAEAAVFVGTGYLAPLAAMQGLAAEATHVLLDPGAHACVREAVGLAGLLTRPFDPRPASGLGRALARLPQGARPVVATDGTFGIRGGVAPLSDYLAALPRTGWLLVDDAHGAGAVGPGGRGTAALLGIERDERLVRTVTFSKAFGLAGGAVLGRRDLIDRIRGGAPAFVGSTAQLLPVVGAIETALRLVTREPARVRRLQANTARLAAALPKAPEILTDPRTPVTAVLPSSPGQVTALRKELLRAGIYPSWIRYLGGPAEGFFRFAVTSEHEAADVLKLAEAIRRGLGIGPGAAAETPGAARPKPRSRR